MKVRNQEILIPTSMVGNYPNPRWWDASWSNLFTGDMHSPDAMQREALEDCVLAIARDQEIAGLDIISDGRVQGDNYVDQIVYYYLKRLGFEMYGGYMEIPLYSKLHACTCTREIRRYGPLMLQQARALKRATNKPIKVSYTGTQVLAQCADDRYYKSSHDRAMAIAKAVNEELLELDAMGVDFIQLDEFTWPYFFEDWAIEAFNRTVEGVKNAQIVVHVCWGNYSGTPGFHMPDPEKAGSTRVCDISYREGYNNPEVSSIIPRAYEANLDVINIESAGRRAGDLSGISVLKKHPLPRNICFWAGVINVKSTIVETADEVAERIRTLLKFVPAEQLGVTTDCGLILLQRYICQDKLHSLVEGTKIVRKELEGAKTRKKEKAA